MFSNHHLHYQDNHHHLDIELILQKILTVAGHGVVIQVQAIYTTK